MKRRGWASSPAPADGGLNAEAQVDCTFNLDALPDGSGLGSWGLAHDRPCSGAPLSLLEMEELKSCVFCGGTENLVWEAGANREVGRLPEEDREEYLNTYVRETADFPTTEFVTVRIGFTRVPGTPYSAACLSCLRRVILFAAEKTVLAGRERMEEAMRDSASLDEESKE